METRFDPAKDAANIARHGISLERAFEMNLNLTLTFEDDRFDYGEDRWISIGPIEADLYLLAHTYRNDKIRPISLRKAEKVERRLYQRGWG